MIFFNAKQLALYLVICGGLRFEALEFGAILRARYQPTPLPPSFIGSYWRFFPLFFCVCFNKNRVSVAHHLLPSLLFFLQQQEMCGVDLFPPSAIRRCHC